MDRMANKAELSDLIHQLTLIRDPIKLWDVDDCSEPNLFVAMVFKELPKTAAKWKGYLGEIIKIVLLNVCENQEWPADEPDHVFDALITTVLESDSDKPEGADLI